MEPLSVSDCIVIIVKCSAVLTHVMRHYKLESLPNLMLIHPPPIQAKKIGEMAVLYN